MYKSNQTRAKEYMENVVFHIEDRELDYDKVIASMMVDVGVSANVAKNMLDAYITAGKLIKQGNVITLPSDILEEIKRKRQEQIARELKEAGL